jgi:hypothetical protein
MNSFEQYQAEWVKKFIAAGHVFKMTAEEGETPEINWWASYEDIHNGPECVRCGDTWCQHCTAPDEIKPCAGETKP